MGFHGLWFISMGVLGGCLWLIGYSITNDKASTEVPPSTGRHLGILIDSRNKMSLSRLQIVLWTWLLLSAIFAVAWIKGTVNIEMATEIWALMGISVGSLAGSVIVKGNKRQQTSDPILLKQLGVDPEQERKDAANGARVSVLHRNTSVSEASPKDLFMGEELTDHNYVDIGKVQNFFFTIILVVGYGTILYSFEWQVCEEVVNFPVFSTTMVTLLGISHAGYLTVKAAPKTPIK